MTTLPLHPALVHVPIGLAFVLPVVAVGLTLALWRRKLPRAAFGVLVGLQAILVGAGIVAMQLGERDEHQVKRVVPERFIEAHEERAEVFVWAAGAVLAGAVAVLVVPASAATGVAAMVAAGTLAVAALGGVAGQAGGELVYRHNAATAFLPGAAPGAPPGVRLEAASGIGAARREDHDE
jgi:uncharacterized membrane protein